MYGTVNIKFLYYVIFSFTCHFMYFTPKNFLSARTFKYRVEHIAVLIKEVP